MKNMNYAKIIDNALLFAPSILKWKGFQIINASEKYYLDAGYKKVNYIKDNILKDSFEEEEEAIKYYF